MSNQNQTSSWQAPQTIEALANCLMVKSADALLLAGGTDLIIKLRQSKKQANIIDLGQIPQLKTITITDKAMTIGSGVCHSRLAADENIKRYLPALSQAAGQIGSVQIRNRGTIGGNIANASPAADLLPVLFALKAKVEILNSNGSLEWLPILELLKPGGGTTLKPNQCIIAVELPLEDNLSSGFVKLGSRSQVTIAQMTACGVVRANGQKKTAEIWFGALGLTPKNLPQADLFFAKGDIAGASKVAAKYIGDNIPIEFDRDYKQHAIQGLLADLQTNLDFYK